MYTLSAFSNLIKVIFTITHTYAYLSISWFWVQISLHSNLHGTHSQYFFCRDIWVLWISFQKSNIGWPQHQIPFKNFLATSASNGGLIKWKIALFHKKNFWQINLCLAGGDWKIGMILVTKWFKNWSFQKMSITTKMPLNWYSSMKKKFRKIRIFFDVENRLWKSEISIFWWLDLECMLIYQKPFSWKRAIYQSIELPFDAEISQNFLHVL